jgi:quercetin dioxygenase-like cupin family protein
MHTIHWKECEDKKIEKFPYRGKKNDVIGTSIRWLSKHGDDGTGYPDYGLRFFTIQPGGQIPIHNHFYHQTMFILEGEFECWAFDPQTDEMTEKAICGAGTSIYIPSTEPHGMKNVSDKPATFLCCICNVYDQEEKI